MYKKILAILCAAALVACLPVLAFAYENSSATGGDNTAANGGSGQSSGKHGSPNAGGMSGKSASPNAGGMSGKSASPNASDMSSNRTAAEIAADADEEKVQAELSNGEQIYKDYADESTGETLYRVTMKEEDGSITKADFVMDKDYKIDDFKVVEEKASNFVEDEKYVKTVSFDIKSQDFDNGGGKVTLAWFAGENNAGLKCMIFIEHGDGTTDSAEAGVDANGKVTVQIDKLSLFTFALTKEKFEGKAGTVEIVATKATKSDDTVLAKDTKATSPKTGGIA